MAEWAERGRELAGRVSGALACTTGKGTYDDGGGVPGTGVTGHPTRRVSNARNHPFAQEVVNPDGVSRQFPTPHRASRTRLALPGVRARKHPAVFSLLIPCTRCQRTAPAENQIIWAERDGTTTVTGARVSSLGLGTLPSWIRQLIHGSYTLDLRSTNKARTGGD